MLHIGIDVHKKSLQICVLGNDGGVESSVRIANSIESVSGYFSSVESSSGVALEATHSWGAIYDLLSDLGLEVHICHSRQAKMIGLASVKNDRVDAYKLAVLLQRGMLPEAYVPDTSGRELRRLVRGRSSLRALSTALKNQVHAILREKWISCPWSDAFGKSGRAFLESLTIPEASKQVIATKLDVLDILEQKIAQLDQEIINRAHLDARAMLISTVPGFAEFRSVMFLAEVVDIRRFARAESLVCFAGLNPREDSSGEKVRRGRITKEGSRWLRWIFVEAAQSAITQEGKIRDLYLRVAAKKGHNKAVVAAARELVVSVYWMLTRMQPYRASGKKLAVASSGEVR